MIQRRSPRSRPITTAGRPFKVGSRERRVLTPTFRVSRVEVGPRGYAVIDGDDVAVARDLSRSEALDVAATANTLTKGGDE